MNFKTLFPELNEHQRRQLERELIDIINSLKIDDRDLDMEYIDPELLITKIKEFLTR